MILDASIRTFRKMIDVGEEICLNLRMEKFPESRGVKYEEQKKKRVEAGWRLCLLYARQMDEETSECFDEYLERIAR